jgi:hypothetical protein
MEYEYFPNSFVAVGHNLGSVDHVSQATCSGASSLKKVL